MLFYLVLPFVFGRLLWRSIEQPIYRRRMGERMGYYPFKLEKCIWVHAVSVGEVLAAIPLIKALKAAYPSMPLLVTTMTPTGAERVRAAFGETVKHAFIPYDLPGAMQRFLQVMQPVVCIIMETELWPNLLATTAQKKIPICLVNARLSEKSASGYQSVAPFTRTLLRQITAIAAQGQIDADRFVALGAEKNKITVTGNLKFDIELPADLAAHSAALRTELGHDRFIWIAASTHDGEEEIILDAHNKLLSTNPQALLILVPRHPNRFDAVAKHCAISFLTARRSLNQACTPATSVYLGDTMGELILLYSVADVAFIGGSLIARGGHNMLEAAALAKPILSGPSLFNFAEISELFIAANAMMIVTDADFLSMMLHTLMLNPKESELMGQRSLQLMQANRGALVKQLALIDSMFSA